MGWSRKNKNNNTSLIEWKGLKHMTFMLAKLWWEGQPKEPWWQKGWLNVTWLAWWLYHWRARVPPSYFEKYQNKSMFKGNKSGAYKAIQRKSASSWNIPRCFPSTSSTIINSAIIYPQGTSTIIVIPAIIYHPSTSTNVFSCGANVPTRLSC